MINSRKYKARDADALYEYRGLFWRRPYLTAVMMLSLAGIPLTGASSASSTWLPRGWCSRRDSLPAEPRANKRNVSPVEAFCFRCQTH